MRESGYFGNRGRGQRVYSIDGKSVTLASASGGWRTKTGLYFIKPKLEPIECERLPDNYTEGISKNQRRKCLGNVDVIAHILKEIKDL